jgi:hypothetical protein
MSRSLVLFLASVFVVAPASAQDEDIFRGIDVTAFFSEDDPDSTLRWSLLDEFREQLSLRGIPEEGRHQSRWFIEFRRAEIDGARQIILAVTRTDRIPEEIVELGAEHEAFYMQMSFRELPEEGKVARIAFSRSWMENYHAVRGQEILIFEPSQAEKAISEYVDRILSA